MDVYIRLKTLLPVFVVGISVSFPNISSATVINVPFSGFIYNINDPNNILSSDLGLNVEEGNSYSGSYTLDDGVLPSSMSNGETYNFYDPSILFSGDFGARGSVNNINNAYRLTVYNDYSSDEYGGWSRRYGGVDAWLVSAAIGFGVDNYGSNYLNIVNFVFLDTTQTMHDSADLYFENSSSGWEYSGLAITQWYADLDDRNTILLETFPLTAVPSPPTVMLLLAGILILFTQIKRTET